MSFNLLDSVKSLFDSDFNAKANSLLGESENNIQKAVSGIIPSLLAGALNKAGSGDAAGILNMAKAVAGSGIVFNPGNLLGIANGNFFSKGTEMLNGLFGDNIRKVTTAISDFSGIKQSSAASLMSVTAPAVLGVLGKHAGETNMNEGGLLSFLNSQKVNILGALPSGLNLAGALGLSNLGSIGNKLWGALSGISGGARDISGGLQQSVKKTSGSVRWLVPLAVAAALGFILWALVKGGKQTNTPQVATSTTIDSPAKLVSSAPEILKVKLPDGVELDAWKGGIEDQLVTFLNDPSATAGRDVWFDFDNLNFETGSTTITHESMKQVQNISAILKAFPNAAIKIGGYTDKTGDSLINIKLSQERADAVVSALNNIGTNPLQLTGAEGYGSQFARTPVDAPDEERKKDRRIAISVRKK